MATIITSDCINCGACEPECPNTAIYAGAVPWEFNGQSNPAIAQDIYYIVPSKCTECVGFHDHEACAAVCPVDCCIPDPNNLETEAALLERARALHPEQTFADDAPSRFRKDGAGGAPATTVAKADAPAAANGAAASVAAAPPAPKPAAPAAKAAAPVATAPLAAAPVASEEYDPSSWKVPVICKDCRQEFAIPYPQFQPGVVFYCPHCSGSFVPNTTLVRNVRDTFEGFYGRYRKELESFERRRAKELADFQARRAAEMEAFKQRLQDLAQAMKPAGKLVRTSGLSSMFT